MTIDTAAIRSENEKRKAIREAATKGPWEVRPKQYDDWGMIRAADEMPVASTGMYARVPDEFQQMPWGPNRHDGPIEVKANADFIAHARTDNAPEAIDQLLDELERKAADDARLVDEAWLESVGFYHEDLHGESPYEWWRYKDEKDLIFWDFNGKYWICQALDQGSIHVEFTTRGQVRDLCKALGIKIKEQP